MQVQQPPAAAAAAPPKKEIYTWTAPWPVYSVGVSNQAPFTIAVGSFIEEYSNKIQVMQLDMESSDFKVRATLEHPYPATRLQWAPDSAPRDLLATSGDYLRLWSIADDEGKMECTLNNVGAPWAPAGRRAAARAPAPSPSSSPSPHPPPPPGAHATPTPPPLASRLPAEQDE